MNRSRRTAAVTLAMTMVFSFISCKTGDRTTTGNVNKVTKATVKTVPSGKTNSSTVTASKKETVSGPMYSNMAGSADQNYVRETLADSLKKEDVDAFLKLVGDYNGAVGEKYLTSGFRKYDTPQYDIDNISKNWTAKKGDFIGTNCRINSYTLLKNSIKIPKIKSDDRLLYLDNEANDKGKLLNPEDLSKFHALFSRVKTENTTDVKKHAEIMEKYMSQFTFSDKASLVTVILQDNL